MGDREVKQKRRSVYARELRESGKYRMRLVETKKKINPRPSTKEILDEYGEPEEGHMDGD